MMRHAQKSTYSHAIFFSTPSLHSDMHINPFTAHFTPKIFFPKNQFAGRGVGYRSYIMYRSYLVYI